MNFKKSKIRSLVLLALAAVAFCGLIWFANKDRPVYRSSNMAGTDYEVGRVLRVVEDHKTVDEEMDGIWRGSMTLEVEILTGRYRCNEAGNKSPGSKSRASGNDCRYALGMWWMFVGMGIQ